MEEVGHGQEENQWCLLRVCLIMIINDYGFLIITLSYGRYILFVLKNLHHTKFLLMLSVFSTLRMIISVFLFGVMS